MVKVLIGCPNELEDLYDAVSDKFDVEIEEDGDRVLFSGDVDELLKLNKIFKDVSPQDDHKVEQFSEGKGRLEASDMFLLDLEDEIIRKCAE